MTPPRPPFGPVEARRGDALAYAAHFQRHIGESGRGDVPHFSPFATVERSEVARDAELGWSVPTGGLAWMRTWLLFASEDRARAEVVGHLTLRGPQLPSAMHRAALSIGIERPYARRGLGRAMIEHAIAFARDELRLAQLDLQVFSTNEPARRLYERLGFRVVGSVPDAYRLDGGAVRIDDVWMVRRLDAP